VIALLDGRLHRKSPEHLVLDCGGVGYQVFVSLQTYARLPEEGARVRLEVVTHVREDAITLFGFADGAERALFLHLKEVSGIGPKLALNVLSGLAVADLRRALRGGDLARLVAIPGVGKKTAERMIVELREKMPPEDALPPSPADGAAERDEAIAALVNLGYRRNEADGAVAAALAEGKHGFEDVIREALRRLGR
jgi:holliday junction DNA helicase RuvA